MKIPKGWKQKCYPRKPHNCTGCIGLCDPITEDDMKTTTELRYLVIQWSGQGSEQVGILIPSANDMVITVIPKTRILSTFNIEVIGDNYNVLGEGDIKKSDELLIKALVFYGAKNPDEKLKGGLNFQFSSFENIVQRAKNEN